MEFLLKHIILQCEAVMEDQQHNVKLGWQLVGNAIAVTLQDVAIQNVLIAAGMLSDSFVKRGKWCVLKEEND